jgi:hypothetical protein
MSLVNRVMSTGKGAKIWFEGNMFCIRKKPNLLKESSMRIGNAPTPAVESRAIWTV